MELVIVCKPLTKTITSYLPWFCKEPDLIETGINATNSEENVYQRIDLIKEYQKPIILNEINDNEKVLTLKKPLYININQVEGGFEAENNELGIMSFGSDFHNAQLSFQEDFIYLLNEIGEEEETKLTNKAKELKHIILSYI